VNVLIIILNNRASLLQVVAVVSIDTDSRCKHRLPASRLSLDKGVFRLGSRYVKIPINPKRIYKIFKMSNGLNRLVRDL
jgi:hypothetical protein